MSAHSITSRGLAGRKIPQGTLTPMGTLLFSASEQGAWYDPSDMSTLFQDSAGTTPVTAVEQPVGRILDKSGRGNHATQATTTKRPVLSRRYNTFTSAENFTAGFWTKAGLSVTPAAIAAPNGTLTASKIVESNTNVAHYVINTTSRTGAHKLSIIAKAGERAWIRVWGSSSFSNAYTNFDLQNGVIGTSSNLVSPSSMVDLGGGWYECSITAIGTGSSGSFGYQIVGGDNGLPYLGDGVSGLYVWGASLTLAIDAHLPYQWVNTATDYDADPAKFPAYLRFDGVDDAMQTGNIDFTSTDKMTVWAGVTKLSDAATSVIVELSATANTNNGAFKVLASEPPGTVIAASSRGTATNAANQRAEISAAPGSFVLSSASDIAGDLVTLRVNSVAAPQAVGDQGAGNYGNYPLYIGGRAGTSLFLNGRLYSLIVRGAQSSLSQIEATELYIKQKMRMP